MVVIEKRIHPFPFRTRKLSSPSPMILRRSGKVGRRQIFKEANSMSLPLFLSELGFLGLMFKTGDENCRKADKYYLCCIFDFIFLVVL